MQGIKMTQEERYEWAGKPAAEIRQGLADWEPRGLWQDYGYVLWNYARRLMWQKARHKKGTRDVVDFEKISRWEEARLEELEGERWSMHDSEAQTELKAKNEMATQRYQTLLQSGLLTSCMTDSFRELVIRHHARGVSTTKALEHILTNVDEVYETPFAVLKYANVCGFENIKGYLQPRVNYLRPGSAKWPAKYQGLWDAEREQYLGELVTVPMTDTTEQVVQLAEHAAFLKERLDQAREASDIAALSRAYLQTLSGLHQLTRDPSYQEQLAAYPEREKAALLSPPKPLPSPERTALPPAAKPLSPPPEKGNVAAIADDAEVRVKK